MKFLQHKNSRLVNIIRYPAILCLLLSPASALANGSPKSSDGISILSESDNFRSLGENFAYNVKVVDSKDRERELTVLMKDRNKALVKLISPSSVAGRSFLYVNNNIWHYSASAGRAFRLHPDYQFLSGIDNLDLAGIGFSNNYKVQDMKYVGAEIQLNLQETAGVSRYQTVILKVNPKDYRPLQASFHQNSEDYLQDGKPKKTVYFENYRTFRNEDHPTLIRIVDHENNDRATIMRFSLLRQIESPDEWFTPQYLERFN